MAANKTYEDHLVEIGKASGVDTISGAEVGSPGDLDAVKQLVHNNT